MVGDEPACHQGMMEICFGKRQRFARISGKLLAQGVVPSFHMSRFAALLAHRSMGLGGKNRLICFPEIAVTVTVTVGLRNALPEAATRLFTMVANDKGRDWYDLYWYLRQAQWPAPNLKMLNSALGQSGWEKGAVTAENWQEYVLARLAQLEWQRVVEDVQRFLMNQEELAEFKREVIEELLAR